MPYPLFPSSPDEKKKRKEKGADYEKIAHRGKKIKVRFYQRSGFRERFRRLFLFSTGDSVYRDCLTRWKVSETRVCLITIKRDDRMEKRN